MRKNSVQCTGELIHGDSTDIAADLCFISQRKIDCPGETQVRWKRKTANCSVGEDM